MCVWRHNVYLETQCVPGGTKSMLSHPIPFHPISFHLKPTCFKTNTTCVEANYESGTSHTTFASAPVTHNYSKIVYIAPPRLRNCQSSRAVPPYTCTPALARAVSDPCNSKTCAAPVLLLCCCYCLVPAPALGLCVCCSLSTQRRHNLCGGKFCVGNRPHTNCVGTGHTK